MEQTLQELVRTLQFFLTALTLMRGGHSLMERPEAFHIHRQVITAVLTTQLLKANQDGLRNQMEKTLKLLEKILELWPWNTAPTSMRDTLLMMERPELLPIHNLVTTAVLHILLLNSITMIWVTFQLPSLAPRDVQMS
jgi:hypothetical protein